jgi:hypothetical protein
MFTGIGLLSWVTSNIVALAMTPVRQLLVSSVIRTNVRGRAGAVWYGRLLYTIGVIVCGPPPGGAVSYDQTIVGLALSVMS